jgi:GDP-L-fucose synthase
MPALIRRFHVAKEKGLPSVTIWGSGQPRREFLHVDDFAEAAVMLMERYDEPEIINVGYGSDVSIAELAVTIAYVVGYKGKIEFDTSKPDGTPQKLLDSSKVFAMGWSPQFGLAPGISHAYEAFLRGEGRNI